MTSVASFDVLILGGGPGGYVAALRAAQLNLKVCLVENEFLGGVCLNKGCIPSKTLLAGTELFHEIKKAGEWGIELGSAPQWNLNRLIKKKDEVISKMRGGLELLCRRRKIFQVKGLGKILSPTQVQVNGGTYSAKRLIIATGSHPKKMDFGVKNHEVIFSSEEALTLRRIPRVLLILGGGPEGCEFALIYQGLGSRVVLVEAKDRLLPGFDPEAGVAVQRALVAKGVEVHSGETILKVVDEGKGLNVLLKNSGKSLLVDALLVSVGRVPNTKEIGLGSVGVGCNEKNAVIVDRSLKTSVSTIYAVGDVLGSHMMAHSASYEGYFAADSIAGKKEILDYSAVPSCVYTYPEAAEVGLNEEKAKERNVAYEIGRFSFMALGRSHAKGQTQGFVKVIGDAKTQGVLGGVIVGEGAVDLINIISLAIKNKLKVKDLRSHVAPHPSASEAVVEAAHLFFKEGLHAG